MKAKKRSWFSKLTDIFFRPRYFFSKIVADGKMEDAILRAFLWGLVGGIIVLIINTTIGNPFSLFGLFKSLIIYPVSAVFMLFVCAGLMMMVSELSTGERDWEIAVKGIASIFFVYPVALVLYTLAFDCISLLIISVLIDLYIFFLIYNIGVYCLHGKKVSVLFVVAVAGMLLACVYMSDYRNLWFLVKSINTTLPCL